MERPAEFYGESDEKVKTNVAADERQITISPEPARKLGLAEGS